MENIKAKILKNISDNFYDLFEFMTNEIFFFFNINKVYSGNTEQLNIVKNEGKYCKMIFSEKMSLYKTT